MPSDQRAILDAVKADIPKVALSVAFPGLLLFGLAAIVLVAGIWGGALLEAYRRSDPDPERRVHRSALTLVQPHFSGRGPSWPTTVTVLEAGAPGGGPILRAAQAEGEVRPAEAHLWLALDAYSLRLPALAELHADLARRALADQVLGDSFETLTTGYPDWIGWAMLPNHSAEALMDRVEKLGSSTFASPGRPFAH